MYHTAKTKSLLEFDFLTASLQVIPVNCPVQHQQWLYNQQWVTLTCISYGNTLTEDFLLLWSRLTTRSKCNTLNTTSIQGPVLALPPLVCAALNKCI